MYVYYLLYIIIYIIYLNLLIYSSFELGFIISPGLH